MEYRIKPYTLIHVDFEFDLPDGEVIDYLVMERERELELSDTGLNKIADEWRYSEIADIMTSDDVERFDIKKAYKDI